MPMVPIITTQMLEKHCGKDKDNAHPMTTQQSQIDDSNFAPIPTFVSDRILFLSLSTWFTINQNDDFMYHE